MATRPGGETRVWRASVVTLGMGMVALCGSALLAGHSPAELFSLTPGELSVDSDAITTSLAAPGTVRGYGDEARRATLAAKADSRALAAAERHEQAAEGVIAGDKAQLSGLYSGSYDSREPLGLHTGNLPTLEGMTNVGGRFSASSDALSAEGAATTAAQVTNTQLAGLQSELHTLNGQKQSIFDSLSLQRQATAAHAARDASYADALRLHRAVATSSARTMRDEARVAQIASQRAKEASVIEQNEEAIAKIASERAKKLGATRDAAVAGARRAESDIQSRTRAERADRAERYHSAYQGYTAKLQKYVAADMATLGRLRSAEDEAAFGPRLHGSAWRQPPVSGALPDIDPAYFMGDAPYRNETTLAEFKQEGGAGGGQTTQLSEQAEHPAAAGGATGDSILRVMREADSELAALDRRRARAEALPSSEALRERRAHEEAGAQLQQLRAVAATEGVPTGLPATAAPPKAAARRGDKHMLLALAAQGAAGTPTAWGGGGAADAPPAGKGFTSFPGASLRSVRASRGDVSGLDDGALIRGARAPVARVAIPVGGHQDASVPRRGGVEAPQATIQDQSTEATAVRADGSHHQGGGAGGAEMRMPHVRD